MPGTTLLRMQEASPSHSTPSSQGTPSVWPVQSLPQQCQEQGLEGSCRRTLLHSCGCCHAHGHCHSCSAGPAQSVSGLLRLLQSGVLYIHVVGRLINQGLDCNWVRSITPNGHLQLLDWTGELTQTASEGNMDTNVELKYHKPQPCNL